MYPTYPTYPARTMPPRPVRHYYDAYRLANNSVSWLTNSLAVRVDGLARDILTFVTVADR